MSTAAVQNLLEQEYMTLAPGVGIVPEKFRNRGYEKLDFSPGEGGIHMPGREKQEAGASQMQQFLAAIAAGADPQEFAKNVLAGEAKTTTSRGRRGSQEA